MNAPILRRAASSWLFSTRWFVHSGGNAYNAAGRNGQFTPSTICKLIYIASLGHAESCLERNLNVENAVIISCLCRNRYAHPHHQSSGGESGSQSRLVPHQMETAVERRAGRPKAPGRRLSLCQVVCT